MWRPVHRRQPRPNLRPCLAQSDGGGARGSMDTVGGAVIGSMDTGNMTSFGEERRREEVIALVVMEMTIGVVGIFINLMVVSSVRSEDCLQESTRTSVPQF